MPVSFAYNYPSATNAYIPSYQGKASSDLIVSFARNPKDFICNKLMTITPVTLEAGYWQRFDPSVLTRVGGLEEVVWMDGQPAPTGAQNTQKFINIAYAAQRKAEPYPIGYKLRDQATWDVPAQAQGVLGHRMMTRRTKALYDLLTTAGNYYSTNTATATALGGGLWSAATAANPYIQKSLDAIDQVVQKVSAGTVSRADCTLLLSPTVAYGMSETAEIRSYLGSSVYALPQLKGDDAQAKNYQLPPVLYGFKVVVDQTIINSAARDVAPSYAYTAPANSAIVLCRPGDVPTNSMQMASNFSSVHLFSYTKEEFTFEMFDEPVNKRMMGLLSDTWDMKIVSPETTFLVTAVLS